MKKAQRAALLWELVQYLKKIDTVQLEAVLVPGRRFRADYCLPNKKIVVEINGGQWINGRHNRGGKGYEDDLQKLNLLQAQGYKVYQFTYEMLLRQEYKQMIK